MKAKKKKKRENPKEPNRRKRDRERREFRFKCGFRFQAASRRNAAETEPGMRDEGEKVGGERYESSMREERRREYVYSSKRRWKKCSRKAPREGFFTNVARTVVR